MLKISCTDNDSIYILSVIQFIVVSSGSNGIACLVFQISHPFISSVIPDVGDSCKLKVKFLVMVQHGWNQGRFTSVGKTDYSYIDLVVCSYDPAVTFRRKSSRSQCGYTRSG